MLHAAAILLLLLLGGCSPVLVQAAAAAAAFGTGELSSQLTICIKHTSRFSRRREMLQTLLASIRKHFGERMRVLVADDGGAARAENLLGAELIALPPAAGLSAGRNALVQAVRTPFLALLDDDVVVHEGTRLGALVSALEARPSALIAGGCYVDVRFAKEDCFNLRFDANEGGSVVRARPVHGVRDGCQRVDAAHNFFVARTTALQRFRWDPRQKVMEHETFFYQLYLNQQEVLACANVNVRHNTTRDEQYRERSFRLQEGRFMQYLCKNYPEIARFETPYLLWRCDTRTYCAPAWHAQFPYDGRECKPMQWSDDDDRSTIERPLVSPAVDSLQRFAVDGVPGGGGGVRSSGTTGNGLDHRVQVPLLVLIFSEARNVARRAWQRATWLSFRWHRGYLGHELVPWRHVYVMSRSPSGSTADAMPPPVFDRIVGDTVTLSNTTESYANLVFKTMEALRWALANVNFQVLLKVDDDSIVHIGRLWAWIYHELPKEDPNAPPPTQLYAGRVFRDSQVVRANFTTADLRRPRWFPASFLKWAVDHSVFPHDTYPPYCGGGGYVLGVDTARKVVLEYDLHYTPARIIPVEDAFVGVLALAQGIAARDLLTFQEPPRGSHQTREMFIDQILVHRVVEPFKAFRWLMLSSNCLASKVACALAFNRTHGLASQKALPTSPDAPDDESAWPKYDKDWISGAIPKASAGALTGKADAIIYDASYREGGAATRPRGRRRRRKGKRRRKRDEK